MLVMEANFPNLLAYDVWKGSICWTLERFNMLDHPQELRKHAGNDRSRQGGLCRTKRYDRS